MSKIQPKRSQEEMERITAELLSDPARPCHPEYGQLLSLDELAHITGLPHEEALQLMVENGVHPLSEEDKTQAGIMSMSLQEESTSGSRYIH